MFPKSPLKSIIIFLYFKYDVVIIFEILHPILDFKGLVLEIKHKLINNDVMVRSMLWAVYTDFLW